MDILIVIFILAAVGVVTWLVITYIPMPEAFKTLITVVAIVGCCIFLYHVFGHYLPHLNV